MDFFRREDISRLLRNWRANFLPTACRSVMKLRWRRGCLYRFSFGVAFNPLPQEHVRYRKYYGTDENTHHAESNQSADNAGEYHNQWQVGAFSDQDRPNKIVHGARY